MAENRTHRRLAAILAADVVGYSRMMGADESGTLTALKRHRETVFGPAVARHGGRVVKLIGDGTLVEFGSVVDAVECALAIQRAIRDEAPPSGIALRIGVNLGDVIIDGDDIYGDGVNVAARLEPLAEPGGICVASIVSESVGNRVDVAFKDGGEVAVKNIDRPIRVWKWHPDDNPGSASPAPAAAMRAPNEQPSIAVLPFDNMSGDPEQEYFTDGITEDIITDLSKVGGLMVIARNSSFAYKRKSVDVRTVGRELGVRSVLEGSIRRAGNRIRITAQLIDAATGAHVWAERYDRDLTDIFAVQDEVTRHIVDALKVKLTPGEAARIADIPTHSPAAHDLFLRARELLLAPKKDREMFEQVVDLLTRCIELDPNYAEAYSGLGMAYNFEFQNRWSGIPDALDLAAHFTALGTEKGPTVPYAHFVATVLAIWKKDLDGARQESKTALALNPNYAEAIGTHGLIEIYSGNPLSGIPFLERAIRLDPAFTHQCMHFLGTAYLVAGKHEAAAASFRERIRLSPETDLSRGLLISALGHLGEIDEARRVWTELKRVSPGYSFASHVARLPFRNPADGENIAEGFARAGLRD
ncbi:MAG: guanylyl cyclase [Betaproteobacteria bacterium]|nr:guanylyl cyclase [Betaproteobacteria bacterium]MBK9608550.1 guanylyl cyclase [Betaproteobacteria bacterium]